MRFWILLFAGGLTAFMCGLSIQKGIYPLATINAFFSIALLSIIVKEHK